MEFGSDYVYHYNEESYECVSDTELEEGLEDFSDSESDEDAPLTVAKSSEAPAGGRGASEPVLGMPLAKGPARPEKTARSKSHWKQDANTNLDRQIGPPPPPVAGKMVRQADTNIISVKFNELIAPSNMHAGDPQLCQKCSAILSKISKVTMEGEDRVWMCEYCGERNIVDVEDEEIPKMDDVTFMLEPALSTTASGPSGNDMSLVVFCIDISGSMCVSTEVQGHVDLRGAESLRRLQSMNTDRSDQYLPSQRRRNVTYISRLQSVQAAIDHQLQEMSSSFPNRRVALITFNSEVSVIGDGKGEPVNITGDKLNDMEKLKTIAQELPNPESIKATRQSLGMKLFDLEEGGPTALGPALQVATTMASMAPGSKVILCTDGMANVGMGKLDNFADETEETASLNFYEDIGTYATGKGVSISVITIKGTDCKLIHLGKLAEKTGGQVNIVDPLKLTQEFSTILANKILATNVVATFILHKDLYFLHEDSEDSKVVKTIGNVTADSTISFEYGVRTKPRTEKSKEKESDQGTRDLNDISESGEEKADDKMEVSGGDTEGAAVQPEASTSKSSTTKGKQKKQNGEPTIKDVPFQLQIVYTDTEGSKAMRLLTKTKPVTKDRRKAEQKINLDVVGRHAEQTSAKMALQGEYTQSRFNAMRHQRMAWRHVHSDDGATKKKAYKGIFCKLKSMENRLASAQQEERSSRGTTYSDEEDNDEDEDDGNGAHASVPGAEKKKKKSLFSFQKKKKKERLNEMSDKDALDVYEML